MVMPHIAVRSAFIAAFFAFVPMVLSAAEARFVREMRRQGAVPGPEVVVVVPARPFETSMELADQLNRWELPKGSLLILEYDGATTGTITTDAVLKAAALRTKGTVVVVAEDVDPLPKSRKNRVPSLRSTNLETAVPQVKQAMSATFVEEVPKINVATLKLEGPAAAHVLRFSASDTTTSRRIRWSRLFVHALLEDRGMAPARESLPRLLAKGERAYAMYDCEGVGGLGPSRLTEIISRTSGGLTLTPISPEDIREGALEPFAGVLFPGGGAKTIATALRPEGQQAVKEFVHGGGGYVGVCAGAYLATCAIDGYLRMVGTNHSQPWARGGSMLEVELTPEGRELLGDEFATFTTRYNNGPVFLGGEGSVPEGEFSPITVLANFKSPAVHSSGRVATDMVGTPAIMASEYGKGRILLVSPHPETHEELNPMMSRGLRWSLGLEPVGE